MEDIDDSWSDFVEEFCMIARSHSSALDRLYAWDRKLYDEVKASESIRKVYDRKCYQLRHQFAKDQGTQVIDKTRAVVKDLHSQIRVAIYSVDSISKRCMKISGKKDFKSEDVWRVCESVLCTCKFNQGSWSTDQIFRSIVQDVWRYQAKKRSGSNCILQLQNYQSWIMLILNYRLWAAICFGDFKRIRKTPKKKNYEHIWSLTLCTCSKKEICKMEYL